MKAIVVLFKVWLRLGCFTARPTSYRAAKVSDFAAAALVSKAASVDTTVEMLTLFVVVALQIPSFGLLSS